MSPTCSRRPSVTILAMALVISAVSCGGFPPKPPTPERAREMVLNQSLPPRVDLIIVHGCPVRNDGAPSTCNQRRARAAVDAWRRGMAPIVLFTGGAVLNKYAEAEVTARYAEGLGLPKAAILVEVESRHTVTNLSVAKGMMKARGMKTALLVSEAMHLVWAKQLADFYHMRTWLWPDDPLPPYTDEYLRRESFDEYEPWKTQTTAYGRPIAELRPLAKGAEPIQAGAAGKAIAVIIVPDRTRDEELWGPLVDELIERPGVQIQIFPWSRYDTLSHSARRLGLFVDAWTRKFNGEIDEVEVVAYGAGGIVAASAASRIHTTASRPVRITTIDAPLGGRAKYASDWSRSSWRAFLWALNGTIRGYLPPAPHVTLSPTTAPFGMDRLLDRGATTTP